MIDWQSFHFIRPEWLYAIIPLLIVALLFKRFKQSSSGWQQVLPSHLHARLLQGEHSAQDKKHGLPVSWLIIAWILSSIALAGPTWERLPQPVLLLSYWRCSSTPHCVPQTQVVWRDPVSTHIRSDDVFDPHKRWGHDHFYY